MMADAAARARALLEEMTPGDDADITAAALLDPDNPPLLATRRDERAGVWLEGDIVARLMADGPDWELRANRILREALGL